MIKPIKGHPGKFLEVSTGKVLVISDYREGNKYDTVALPAEILGAEEFVFFKNIARKPKADCNFSQPSKLNPGENMVVDRVGLYTRSVVGDTGDEGDVIIVSENSHLRIEINQLLFVEGPSICFPSGYGYNSTMVPNLGEVSPVLATKLMRTQFINYNHDIVGYLTFGSRNWAIPALGPGWETGMIDEVELVPACLVSCLLHGLIKDAATK